MNTLGITRRGAVALLCFARISATAVTLTNDTYIGSADLSKEGRDIVITNCTLTVDGSHTFNSLQVLNGGVVTHSPFTNGPLQFTVFTAHEAHVMSATNPATLNNPNVDTNTISVFNASLTALYTEDVDYVVTFSGQSVQLTLTTNSAIAEGATVLVNYDWTQNLQGFFLAVNNDFTITPGGAINVSGKGYAGGNGDPNGVGTSKSTNLPFAFTAGAGGGHGGAGGMSSTFASGGGTYDSTTEPDALGSGGAAGSASGGAGGGTATVLVGRNFQVDGQILAAGFRGTNAHSGGGAGGSILISAETISGTGAISANGGSGDTPDGGGGGGGRIALYFATNNFAGTISAFGGGGAMAGGAGTVFLQSDADAVGQLLIVNGGKRGTNTTFAAAVSDLTISGGAIVLKDPNQILSVTNLFLGSNSWLTCPDSAQLTLTVNGNALVEANAMINADFKSANGAGPGSATCGAGSGGGYGGYGGASVCGAPGGQVYGSISQPSSLGSPGASSSLSHGGGAIKMTVLGNLSLDGKISANGASAVSANSGSGSGGSVWLTVGKLSGAGLISANGGSSSNLVSGGGGGGRVALYFDTNIFTGSITARGGTGTNSGGPGSIYLKGSTQIANSPGPIPQIIFDNGGTVGRTYLLENLVASDLTISGGTILTNYVQQSPSSYLRNLFIGSNSWLFSWPYPQASLTLSATNVTIQAGGGIINDGNSAGSSLADGQSFGGAGAAGGGGGGGFGGVGGSGRTNSLGGAALTNFQSPSTGGGNGGSSGPYGPGGTGGGVISLNIPGTLLLDGRISVNGNPSVNINGGGGAGGSIRISARTISGTGTISANGGAGNTAGGGGGGGAIALLTDTNLFLGSITAVGGSGAGFGGAGTIYSAPFSSGKTPRQLLVDNGGNRGARTPLTSSADISDLIVTGGAAVSNAMTTLSQINNLLVGSNSTFQIFATFPSTLNISSNITIQPGGSLNADGASGATSLGMGQTASFMGGGGGSGGGGGASFQNFAAGGSPFTDSIVSPTSLGGRGGGGSQGIPNGSSGGNGGGALKVTVGGTLLIDGRLSADGATATNANSGGGAGGSLWITTKALSGSGVVSANGGAGLIFGGGGGGGHVAISYTTTNSFIGNLMARGGSGANYGGAGIIYLTGTPGPNKVATDLIVDNGGVPGGITSLFSQIPGNPNLTVTGGAILTNGFTPTSLQNLLVGSNSIWFPPPSSTFTVLSNATIQASGAILTEGNSSGQSQGQTVTGKGGGGGGHGGYGGSSISNALGGNITSDSLSGPTGTGSSGGSSGGLGGGSLQITVNGLMQLDGKISANGATSLVNMNSGGGSGGSVWLKAGKLSGAGSISANGGAANSLGGGGGGGRVAVWANTNLFTGTYAARGGAGANYGGAGTIYLNPSLLDGRPGSRLIVDNGGVRGTNTGLIGNLYFSSFMDVIITNGGSLSVGQLQTPACNNLTICSNSSLTLASNFATLHLQINSNLDIQPGGAITLDGQGSVANTGTGYGYADPNSGGGGGHGGFGSSGNSANAVGGLSYDPITAPTSPGSGGGSGIVTFGSRGGGAMRLLVLGVCKINGAISVDGSPAITSGAGGGSGGSLYLTAGTISGSGKISADGGDGDVFTSGGGGGGRIALIFNTNLFTGTISAHGGEGFLLAGGAGTIYLKANNANVGQLIVDNANLIGTNTPLSSTPQLFELTPPAALFIRNEAVVSSTEAVSVASLSITSNGNFVARSTFPITMTVAGDALVDSNATISADSAGNVPNFGAGHGNTDFTGDGSGGGYGGAGGASFFGASGGGTYGSSNQPVDLGSPGGVFPTLIGYSHGGGAIRLIVNGALTVNGNVSANGANGFIDGSGGGSGGSIWVTAHKLSGNGFFTANGGQGESFEGGGGGGGRIAIYAASNTFSGTISAFGGDGAMPGQDGTIYIPTSVLISGSVTNLNGTGAPGFTLQPSGLAAVISDGNGHYSISVPIGWNGSISGSIVPSLRTYANVYADMPNQDFLAASPSVFNLYNEQFDGTNISFTWYGVSGVTYQLMISTDLVHWTPYTGPIPGSNAPFTVLKAVSESPQLYFRLSVTY